MLQLSRKDDGHAGEGYGVINPDSIQHINVKIFVANPDSSILDHAVKVFHQWIKDSVCPELLIDVAEYRHVPAGPGVLLIGHEANYSFDERENRLGLLYNRKAALEGTFQSRLAQAHHAALVACDRLEQDAAFGGRLKFDRSSLEVFVNDRLLAPNTDETWQALKPELEEYFPGSAIRRHGEPRDLFRVEVSPG
jgi:hypothetical protein